MISFNYHGNVRPDLADSNGLRIASMSMKFLQLLFLFLLHSVKKKFSRDGGDVHE
jgi:hypothetical protein